MPEDLIFYITQYGYLAIFFLVFLQEIGAPNPIPNELVLLFSGYMVFLGVLNLPMVILTTVSADFIGSSILHTTFYFSGSYLLQIKPQWIPIPIRTIEKLMEKTSKSGLSVIFIGRLTPFIRGYTSVIAGLLQIKSKIFLPIALITGSIWASIYVGAGIILGPFWNHVIDNIHNIKYFFLFIFCSVLFVILLRFLIKYKILKNK
jgi:membrane protein DedA with SNARE-associated domain